ncbi:MAG TPA: LLM class flavin-dependent oxidoreductase [Actinomycetota bacterium]|nr:LLM class flavin-dependent oxidoreductase [Actinomycetota bacterium]
MRFGLFYEHQLPRPWSDGAEERLLQNALEQVELADRLGFDYVWEVEHHFLEEYSHSSAPEIFLAAASQRTKRIRLGHGIVQLPPTFNHPVRVAERIATLDLISGGRVEFGTGESSSQMELGGFGIPREEKRKQWREALDAITRMFVEEPFAGYDGEFISVPQRNVIPKPKQKPHPPLWAACSQRDTILLAARNGIGALSFSFVDPEAAKEWVDAYYELIVSDECVPAGFEVNPNFAVVVPLMCHEDEDTAIQQGIDGGHFFGYSLAHYYVFGEHHPGRTDVWDEFEKHRSEYGFAREIIRAQDGEIGVKVLEGGLGSMRGAIGTPNQIADLVRRYEAAGVDQIIFVAQCGNNVHEQVCASLELFGREVLPRFAAEADAKEAAKKERLGDAIAEAMTRREGPRAAADYLVTPKGEDAPSAGYVLPGVSGDAPARPAPARQTEVFGALVRHLNDDQIEDVFGSEKGSAPIFEGMAASFNPEGAMGFVGKIQYRLGSNGSAVEWYVDVDKEKAVAAPGVAERPALTIEASVADFVRIAAGVLNGAKAAMEGKLRFEGELDLALRLQRMFGGDSLY